LIAYLNQEIQPYMMRFATFLALTASFGLGFFTNGLAQEAKPAPKQEAKKEEPKKEEAKKEEPKQDPKVTEYEKAIKDLKRLEGNLTLYQRKKDILLELPESHLGKILLFQASFHSGVMGDGITAGFPVGDFAISAFRFDKADETIQLVRPNLAYRWGKKDPLSEASAKSFPEAILGSFRIENSHPEKKLHLVNITQLFYGDVVRLSEGVAAMLGGPYNLDREKSGPESVKVFPDNVNVQMKLHYYSPRGSEPNPFLAMLGLASESQLEDSRSAPIKVTYNMWWRRETGYKPRLADPRVGYFTTDFFNVGRFLTDDRTERYVNRFHLEKKDPGAKLSEPVKPIVWYIDSSVPPAYREAMKAGVLYWNKAFEALGYKNALVVKDAPENDPDWDHADARFNVLRWTMSPGASYAIALARTDPFTGEVLNASVNFDAGMLATAFKEQERFTMPGAGNLKRAVEILTAQPEREHGLSTDAYLWDGPLALYRKQMNEKLHGLGWHAYSCTFAHGKAESASFAWTAAAASGKKVSTDSYAKSFLTEIAAHEIGHTLGLRHNFVASTRLGTQELADDSITGRVGNTASVMEYSPVNIMAVLTQAQNFFSPTIGEYDLWAIRYGYESVAGTNGPASETSFLSRIAAESGRPGHKYMSDEQADGFDPFVVRFDHSKDPVAYSEKVLQAAHNIRQYAIRHLPRPGENYAKRTQMILSSLTRTFREGRLASRFVGGLVGNKAFKGDAGQSATLQPVSVEDQRKAIRLITKHCFDAEAFRLPADVLNNLQQDYSDGSANGWTAPLREMIGNQQQMLFAQLMSATTTKRIAENAFKSGKGAYTMDEHFGILLAAVFQEIGRNESVAALRRDLQRFALNGLMVQAGANHGAVSEDVRMLASDALRRLSARFGKQLQTTKGLDALTVVHLKEAKETTDRFLARQSVGR
jgi:hypothetical protein